MAAPVEGFQVFSMIEQISNTLSVYSSKISDFMEKHKDLIERVVVVALGTFGLIFFTVPTVASFVAGVFLKDCIESKIIASIKKVWNGLNPSSRFVFGGSLALACTAILISCPTVGFVGFGLYAGSQLTNFFNQQ